MAPASLPPARPAGSHFHPGDPGSHTVLLWESWLCFVSRPWRRGLLPSPVELEPKVSPAPSWSSTQAPPISGFWLAGCPARPRRHALACSPAPWALAPCHHPLVALSPPLMPTCSCSSPPCPAGHNAAVSSPGAGLQHQYILMRKRHQLAHPVCAFKSANDFQMPGAGSVPGAVPSAVGGTHGASTAPTFESHQRL